MTQTYWALNRILAESAFRKPALDWCVTVANFVEWLKQSVLFCRLNGLDISGWRFVRIEKVNARRVQLNARVHDPGV